MKTLILNTVLILLMAVALFSCIKEETAKLREPDKAALNIQTAVTNTATRAVMKDFPVHAALSLFVTNGNTDTNYGLTNTNFNVRAIFDGTGWNLTPEVNLYKQEAVIYAFYPYINSPTDAKFLPVEHRSQTDYMYGKNPLVPVVNAVHPTATIQMCHALSLVQFRMNKKEYPRSGKLAMLSIENIPGEKALYGKGTLNVMTGIVTPTPGENQSAYLAIPDGFYNIPDEVPTQEETFPRLLVLPTAEIGTNEVRFTFSIDGYVYEYILPAGTEWKGGKKYTYNVTITGNKMKVGNVSIIDWLPGEESNAEIF